MKEKTDQITFSESFVTGLEVFCLSFIFEFDSYVNLK